MKRYRPSWLRRGRPQPRIYVVQPGDSLRMIAQRFSVTVRDIEDMNPGLAGIPPEMLWSGDQLTIPNPPRTYGSRRLE